VERLRDVALDEFGRVDAWVNNVGRGIPWSVLDLTDGEGEETMAVNLEASSRPARRHRHADLIPVARPLSSSTLHADGRERVGCRVGDRLSSGVAGGRSVRAGSRRRAWMENSVTDRRMRSNRVEWDRVRPGWAPRVSALLAAFTLAAAAGCSSGPKQQLQTISSWAATAHMTADELRAHHTTWRYSAKTLQVARDQVDKQAKALKPDKLPPEVRGRAGDAISAARDAIDSLRLVTERRDRVALGPHAARADAAAQALDSIVSLIEDQ